MTPNAPTRRRWYVDLTGLAVCAGATLVLYLAGVRPLVRRQEHLASRRASLQAQRRLARDLARSLSALEDRLAEARRTLATSPVRLPSSADVNRRIAQVARMATECGLRLDQIQPGPLSDGTRYQTIPFSLVGTGNYRTCATLLHRLRETFPDAAITSLELSGDPSDPHGAARFHIDLLWHAAPNLQAAKE